MKGVVDGVITNDGDCFLYGGRVLYTRFSVENLEKGQVMRYDARELRAVCISETGEEDEHEEDNMLDDDDEPQVFQPRMLSLEQQQESESMIPLSRNDLVAFALLTGSDLFGQGLPCVGYKKAIRFIQGSKTRCCGRDRTCIAECSTIMERCRS